jgi:methionyl-tRNA synthetase
VSFTREWAERRGTPDAWREWWRPDDPDATRLVHFIGKDNIPFHCIVFPAMLHGTHQGYVLPWQVPANEFYNLQGAKFSTSQGWSIPLADFFARYDAEVARFYLLSSAPETADSDFRWEDYQRQANLLADVVGNLVTRLLRFVDKHYAGRVPPLAREHEEELDRLLLTQCGAIGDPFEHVRAFRFRRAAEQLLSNAAVANVFVDQTAPWSLQKSDPARAASVLATGVDYLAWIARWLAPFLPRKAQALWSMLGERGAVAEQRAPGVPVAGAWRRARAGEPLGSVAALFAKIDDAQVASELEALAQRASAR